MALLKVDAVSKHFGGIEALREVSFSVHEGQIKALIGPNGAGKTTLFNVASGSCRPSAGRVLFADIDVAHRPAHHVCRMGLGRTFQHSHLFEEMSLLENVAVGHYCRTKAGLVSAALTLPSHRREEGQTRKAALESLKRVGLDRRCDEPASSLPMGERHLVEIARALVAAPRLMLLDEPAAGLNEEETGRLAETVVKIRDEGVTVLLVEHDMTFVMDISDEVVVLDHGVKIAEGPPLIIQENEEVIKAYLGEELL